jgi:hypothetical protein
MSLDPNKPWKRSAFVAAHTVAAGIFVFTLQYFGLKQSLDSSLLWAAVFAVAAAGLAWKQTAQ